MDGGDNLSYIVAADLFHFEGSSVEVAVFPPELIGIRVVFKVFFGV